jgi:hypothetical protein
MNRWRAVALAVLVLGVLAPARASAASGPDGAGRVLVLSLPGLSWDELYQGDTPALDRLLDESAVGAMSVRDVVRQTSPGDAYAAISAGARARGVRLSGEVFEPHEEVYGVSARALYEQLLGAPAPDGLLALGYPALVERNEDLDYDAEIGALGEALAAADVPRAAIANADGAGYLQGPPYHRGAAVALVDERAVIPDGAVGPQLLEAVPAAPYGVRLSNDAVADEFERTWYRGGVVLVEGSDLARADRHTADEPLAQRAEARRTALRWTDELVAELLANVDPARDSVLVVGPYHRRGAAHLTVAGLRAPDVQPGLLRSGTTRRTGIVTLVDIAPTILDQAGVGRPSSMEGRRFERAADGPSTGEARAEYLAEIDAEARYRDRMVAPVALTFVVLQAVLWVLAAVALRRRDPRARTVVAFSALAMLAYLPATYLARLIDFHSAREWAYWAFLAAVAVGIALLAAAIGRGRRLDALLICLGVVYGLLAIDMLIGAPLQLNAVFGYSPTVGGRFAGMGNLAYGQFAAAAFLLFGLVLQRLAGWRFATAAALAVLVAAVIIDGMPMWGSDVGGVLAFVPAVGVTLALLSNRGISVRSVVLWGSLGVVAVAAFALVDLSRPADQRTHLGRLVESIDDRGWDALESVIVRKLDANFSVIGSSVWTAMVPVALGFIVYLLWRAPGHVEAIRDTIRESLPGLAVVGFLGFALNDSGIAVPGVMLGVVNASLVYLAMQMEPPEEAPA